MAVFFSPALAVAETDVSGLPMEQRVAAERQMIEKILATTDAAEMGSRHSDPGPRCLDYSPFRSPFFGDLHIHTSLSMDAVFLSGNLLNGPREAYRFARGEPMGFPPFDADGNPAGTVQLRRPLDFAAVTDHAEFFGEVEICFSPEHPGFDSPECVALRNIGAIGPAVALWGVPTNRPVPPRPRRFELCGDDGSACLEVAATVWAEVRAAAAEATDSPPSCSFTAFNAYEWTKTPNGAHLHRNVIFRNEEVPDLPASFLDAPFREELWEFLENECLNAGTGCDVIAIPHNPNMSQGLAFLPESSDGTPLTAEAAARRVAREPLVEIIQNKGGSECRTGVGTTDELCEFELLQRFPGAPPEPPLSFVRNALKQGLLERERIGVNPFQYGLVGGTDTHNSTGGATGEDEYRGGFALADGSFQQRMQIPFVSGNPGGLTVAWAEQNTRESLFEALRRREVYATSGTRPVVRFFGSFLFPQLVDLCQLPFAVPVGYVLGAPMGGELDPPRAIAERRSPRFFVSALKDPGVGGAPGTQLERIQVVKGFVEGGEAREVVFEVAGASPSSATVDPATGETVGPGFDQLCTVWEDPQFDPGQAAFYYARVLEKPSLRWSARQCRAAGVDCGDPGAIPPGLENCCNPDFPQEIRERAWTSPIWYLPPSP
ncbi:MAG: DUF3604 domain-containing protein [Holophagales bacterium]|nr:DUF3604 domain-containing protein [Holophagales bacterium]